MPVVLRLIPPCPANHHELYDNAGAMGVKFQEGLCQAGFNILDTWGCDAPGRRVQGWGYFWSHGWD